MARPWRSAILPLVLLFMPGESAYHGARSEVVTPSTRRSGRSECDRARFRVVLDVGHTIEVPGAISARGVPEYEFNLRLARKMEETLLDRGFDRTVVLITGGAAYSSLVSRVARANSLPADLFLSVHHDSVPERFLRTWEHDGQQRRFSDEFKGHSIFISRDNGQAKSSLLFARFLGEQLKNRGLRYTTHYAETFMGERQRKLVDAAAGVYRYDQLIVLRDTRMPAVLLEAGSIINRDEEKLMTDPRHQSRISAAVADAVEVFCSLRPSQSK